MQNRAGDSAISIAGDAPKVPVTNCRPGTRNLCGMRSSKATLSSPSDHVKPALKFREKARDVAMYQGNNGRVLLKPDELQRLMDNS